MDRELNKTAKETYEQPKVTETASLKEITKLEGEIVLTSLTNTSTGDDD